MKNLVSERMHRLLNRRINRTGVIHPEHITALEYHPLEEVSSSRVGYYRERLLERKKVTPIVVVGPFNRIVDGRHRVAAAKLEDLEIPFIRISESEYESYVHKIPMLSLEDIANKVLEKWNS